MRVAHRHRTPLRHLATTDRARRAGGYVLVEFAFLLVPLLLMVGLSVDVGYWYNRASDIQKAADAAALAGVVWLPDVAKAETYARQAAARNGFVDGTNDVDIDVEPVGERRLRVTIEDKSVGSFFYKVLGGRDISLTRDGLAEYVLPVPLGSPKNYFGTGSLLSDPELLYQSVNPACTSKVNGDRHQSLHFNPLNSSASLTSCALQPTNSDYRTRGYELYVTAPPGRTSNIDVLLYDPRYNQSDITYQVQTGTDCQIDYESSWRGPVSNNSNNLTIYGHARYQTWNTNGWWNSEQTLDSGSSFTHRRDRLRYRYALYDYATSYTGPNNSSSSNLTITGPLLYSTRPGTSGSQANQWSSDTMLNPGEQYTFPRNRLRYRPATGTQTTCTPVYETRTDYGIDSFRKSGNEDFHFTLMSENGTPLDDSDNYALPGCTKTYTSSTAFELDYLGSKRWNKLCTITPAMASGTYILRASNTPNSANTADGSNQWGLVAKYANATGDGLCDGRTDATCPRVYGRDAISVYANTSSASASFFLAEIPEYHTGKTLELELWDPGEGGSHIEILQPTGANTWGNKTFSWTSYDEGSTTAVASGTNVTQVSVTGNVFNGRLLRIRINLDNYSPPASNKWWRIKYTFGSGSVTDRTTWSAKVIGDPVHLVEDEL